MKKNSIKVTSAFAISMFSMFLFSSCRDEMSQMENTDKANVASELSLKASTIDLPGRTLAANCFQCHGTNGYAGELKIAGQGASEIISKFNEFKAKDPRSNIMNVHAHGYTDEQIKLIADYISKQ